MKNTGEFDISKDAFIRDAQAYKTILDERSFEMLRLKVMEELSYVDIAKLYGLSSTRIKQICGRSVERIKKARYELI